MDGDVNNISYVSVGTLDDDRARTGSLVEALAMSCKYKGELPRKYHVLCMVRFTESSYAVDGTSEIWAFDGGKGVKIG